MGNRAKDRLEDDAENAFSEFKLQMGTGAEYEFTRNGRKMNPAELSAEVLKTLKENVSQMTGEEVSAAVITVPAAFESRQCDATNEAAKLAGFSASPLLQEPVAAALTYSFQNYDNDTFWLVYDLGGGTFDAAIIQVKDSIIQVVDHDGDNSLGGKLIDWQIVDELLIPALVRENKLTDFKRGNRKWAAAVAKLKHHAEKAKIRLSREDSTEIYIDPLCLDDDGNLVTFEYELTLKDLERLAYPVIRRSINICRNVLKQNNLATADIEKVVLVGGPTLMPSLREILAHKKKGLGIPLEYRIDPITAVARGAAVFAGTQRLTAVQQRPEDENEYAVQLEYEPITPDSEPLAAGRILFNEDKDFGGYTFDIPAGSDIEITIDIDQSRIIRTKAYIPILDEEFQSILRFDHSAPDVQELEKEVESEKLRLSEVRQKLGNDRAPKVREALHKIADENMEHEIDSALAAADADRDAADKCKNRLLDLKATIDELEEAVKWPMLLDKAKESLDDARKIKDKYGESADSRRFDLLEKGINQAIASRDADLLDQKIDEVDSLYAKILQGQPGFWAAYLEFLEERKSEIRNSSQADKLISMGKKAVVSDDLQQLKAVVQQLISLFPENRQHEVRGYGGTTTR